MKYPIIFFAFLVANAKGECIKLPQKIKDVVGPIVDKCAPDLAMRADESDRTEESAGVAGAGAALIKEMLGNFRNSPQSVDRQGCPTLENIAAAIEDKPVLLCFGEELGLWTDKDKSGTLEVDVELILEDFLAALGAGTLLKLLKPEFAQEAKSALGAAAEKCGLQVPKTDIKTYIAEGCPEFKGFVGQIECFYKWIAAEAKKVCVA